MIIMPSYIPNVPFLGKLWRGGHNVWFKSLVKHPPPGAFHFLSPKIVKSPGVGRILQMKTPGMGNEFSWNTRGWGVYSKWKSRGWGTNFREIPGVGEIMGVKSPPVPGGGCLTTDLNHTLEIVNIEIFSIFFCSMYHVAQVLYHCEFISITV